MLLYCFLSHKSADSSFIENIHNMMKRIKTADYIICAGGYQTSEFDADTRILKLNCNDHYEGLPEKIYKIFSFVVNDSRFSGYTHFHKLDHDVIVKRPLELSSFKSFHYSGKIRAKKGPRDNHIGMCSKGSYFNTHIYEGPFVPYCYGGLSYIVSRKSANVIANSPEAFEKEIYEDLSVGKVLTEANIHPQDIGKIMRKHILSKDHGHLFWPFPIRLVRFVGIDLNNFPK